jgi:hypothetical protein
VKRPDYLFAFKVLPRRRVVERTLAWSPGTAGLSAYPHHETYVYWVMIMTRCLARKTAPPSTAPEPQLT